MKPVLLALALMAANCPAAEWVIVEGGLSPDQKLAVAVFPQKTEFIDEADGTVLLIDAQKQKRIGPLEEVESTGGGYGSVKTNVHCFWSSEGEMLLLNFRCGRLMHGFQIYRISNRRAIPVELPAYATHPKGKMLMEVLTTGANGVAEVWFSKDGAIMKRVSGLVPRREYWGEDISKYGLQDHDDSLLFRYNLEKNGSIELSDVTVWKGFKPD